MFQSYFFSPFTEKDAPALATLMNLAELSLQLTDLPQPYTTQHALAFIRSNQIFYAQHSLYTNLAIKNNSQMLCGGFGIKLKESDKPQNAKDAEMGYWIAPQFQNKGMASYFLPEFLTYLKINTQIISVNAFVKKDHLSSVNLLKKCRFLLEVEGLLYPTKDNKEYHCNRFRKKLSL